MEEKFDKKRETLADWWRALESFFLLNSSSFLLQRYFLICVHLFQLRIFYGDEELLSNLILQWWKEVSFLLSFKVPLKISFSPRPLGLFLPRSSLAICSRIFPSSSFFLLVIEGGSSSLKLDISRMKRLSMQAGFLIPSPSQSWGPWAKIGIGWTLILFFRWDDAIFWSSKTSVGLKLFVPSRFGLWLDVGGIWKDCNTPGTSHHIKLKSFTS